MAGSKTVKKTAEYTKRFDERYDELKWLYCELYNNNMEAFDWLCDSLYGYYQERNADLKKLDRSRVKNPDWYKQNDLLGMMMYTNAFAGTLKGVKEKLPYVKSCGVNYLHFMPLLESPKGRDDGGYAVADFRKVKPELGTMEDLEDLTAECHRQGISCCLDFVMNHTSEDHEGQGQREMEILLQDPDISSMMIGSFLTYMRRLCLRYSQLRRLVTSHG